jgi:oligopeptide transport system substrate-binding protein
VFAHNVGDSYRRLQQLLWAEGLGIPMRWEAVSLSEMDVLTHEEWPHVFLGGWGADYPDPDNFLRVAIESLRRRWDNETYSRLVEEARHTMDQSKRMQLYRQADRILIEEAVVVPVEYGSEPWLVKPWVTRFPRSAQFGPQFWKDVILEPH